MLMDNSNVEKPYLLIVDDEPINIRQIGSFLNEEYNIIVAVDGEQAIKLALSEPQPELILLDVVMPQMDGYEVCQQLKNNSASQHIPIIFLTANDKEEDESRGFELGAVDYIKKPFRPLVDLKRIKTQINHSKDNKKQLYEVLNCLPWATFIINNDLIVVSYNEQSQLLLDDTNADFAIKNKKLTYVRQASLLTTFIQQEINHLIKNNKDESAKITILKGKSHSYRLYINKLEHNYSRQETSKYIVYINKFSEYFSMDKQLKALYDFTAAEARLANSMINGLSLEEIAQQNNLKYNTLKSYLKVIFQKTGTNKQHELVSTILRNFTCHI